MEIGVLLVGWGWTYQQMRSGWTEIERLGYDICYLGDDLFPHPRGDDAVWEPWAILPAIAATTRTIKMGSLVSPVDRRHPGLFAKTTSAVDQIAGGRLIVGRGLGNAPEQQRSLNQRFHPPAERTEMLREELQILRSMWTRRRTTFEGHYYQVRNARNDPKPVGAPHPEILLAYRSKRFLPPLAAEFADRVNLLGGNDRSITEHIELLARECERYGRDVSDITVGRPVSVIFTDEVLPPGRLEPFLRHRALEIGADPGDFVREHTGRLLSYVGPPNDCAEALRPRSSAIGVRELVLCVETIGKNTYERTMEGLRTFAEAVIPHLKD